MEGIMKCECNESYCCKLTGFGDIYEEMSVRRMMQRLRSAYPLEAVYLSSNREHSGRGVSIEELVEHAETEGYEVLEKGFVDTPPWGSRPRPEGDENRLMHNKVLNVLGKVAIWFIIFLEPLHRGRRSSHMVYVAARKKRVA